MNESVDVQKLAADFEAATREQWLALVEKALKGGDFEKRLVSKTPDGIALQPLYMPQPHGARIGRTNAGLPWHVSARVDHPIPAESATQALEDLENACDTLTLVFPASRSARGFGMACETVDDLEASLSGVGLDMIGLRLDPAPGGRIHAALVAGLVARRRHSPADLRIDFGLDPLGTLTHTGGFPGSWDDVGRRLADVVTTLKADGFRGPFVTCDTRPAHEAGASEAQELAVALASGVAYLRALNANGLSTNEARAAMSWTMAIDADQFMGLAKLRTLRRLWARVEDASGLTPRPITIHAEMAWRMMTRRDPWVNMLRATMATFTAGIGGADTMTVLPHTLPLGLPDAFARRIARNTQTVLLEESNLWRVSDPAAGSGAYEALSDDLADKAWAAFQDIEAEGGIVASLGAGKLQDRIAATRAARDESVARRQTPITGTSEFPLLSEAPLEVLDLPADAVSGPPKLRDGAPDLAFAEIVSKLADGAGRSDVTPERIYGGLSARVLPPHRLAEPFEALRDASDAHLEAHGSRPTVFLACMGRIAEHTARSTWIRNLLAAGGIDAAQHPGFATTEEAAEAFKANGARAACICSSDAVYAELAVATAAALKAAGAQCVMLAGKPGDLEDDLKSAGIDGFIFAGQDVLAMLTELQHKLAA